MPNRRTHRTLAISAAVATALPLAIPAPAAEPAHVVTTTGAPAPGLAAGATFAEFSQAVVDPAGQVLFKARTTGAGISSSNDTGLWGGAAGSITRVISEGMSVPGAPAGTTFDDAGFFSNAGGEKMVLGDGGRLAFQNSIKSGTNKANALFTGALGGTLRQLAQQGQPLGGAADKLGSSVPYLRMNPAGLVLFTSDSTNGASAWVGTSAASLRPIARPGDSFGGKTIPGVGHVALTRAGQVAFAASPKYYQDGTASLLATTASPTNVARLVSAGDPAPGINPPTTLQTFDPVVLNPANDFLLIAHPASSTNAAVTGLWRGGLAKGANLVKILAPGDPAPGAGAAKFAAVSDAVLTPTGRFFVRADLAGPGVTNANITGIWTGSSASDLTLLAREGNPIKLPGFTENWGTPAAPAVNAAGQAVIAARLPNFRQALIGYEPSLGLVPLAATGDSVEISPGLTKTISSLTSSGDDFVFPRGSYNDGLGAGLNDQGVLTYRAVFTDNSQAILTTRIPVAGDATFDGVVDNADLKTLLAHFNQPGARADGDFDLSGRVDFHDFQLLELNFGRHPPGAAAPALDLSALQAVAASVPEPGPTLFLLSGPAPLLVRRRGAPRATALTKN